MAVYRSWEGDDPSAFAFVVAAYVSLVLLFRCLHLLEVERRRRRRRDQDQHLKLGVWGLSTLLTLMFSYKVAAIVPLWAQLLVWATGTFTVLAGLYAFFLARHGPVEGEER